MSISDSQNDTSQLNIETAAVRLRVLDDFQSQLPFSVLLKTLKATLGAQYSSSILGAKLLNDLKQNNSHDTALELLPNFAEQAEYTQDSRFYEQIIFQDYQVPTRNNWHDFFNGLIWLQFPQTKRYFTNTHNQQINDHGLKVRTAVRDRITHFDECGLLIITNNCDLDNDIAEHNWKKVFVEQQACWHQTIIPIIFGHALWEMLMSPFIGLTAKVKVLCLPELSAPQLQALAQQGSFYNEGLDNTIVNALQADQDLFKTKPWRPLPLLGVPAWSPFEQNHAFYTNQQYFMPKRSA